MASSFDKLQRPKGGFDCEFVESPPSVLQTECPVCLLIIQEPHQVSCCGNIFCQSCIEYVRTSKSPCPGCNDKEYSYFSDKRLKCTIYAFKVHCSHKEDGCEWTGELGQLEAHLNRYPQPGKEFDGCQFAEIDCLYECGDQVQRHCIQSHQIEHCIKRPFSCEHCHDYDTNYADVIHKHWPVCGSFPVHCPIGCGLELPRQKVGDHVDNDCPLTTINCDFHHVGCSVTLPRKDMSEHLRKNLLTHTSLLATSHAMQQATISNLISLNKSHKSEQLAMKQTIETLKEENEQLKTNIVILSLKLDHISTPRTSVPLAPPVLIMSNFQQHRRNKVIWLSPPVYTHNQGYKICLRVDASGHGVDGHVSVFLHFMKGEFDTLLKWPFRGAIHLQVLDQVDGSDNVKHVFKYNDTIRDSACSKVTTGEMSATGCGESRLIAHSVLEPKYLRNDNLLFQIDKVELC